MNRPAATPRLVIRPMRRTDAKAMVGMMRRLQTFQGDKSVTTAAQFATYCCGKNKLADAWIATVGGAPAAFAVTRDWMNFVRALPVRTLHLLYVAELFRGHGIGTALVAAIAREGMKKGIRRFDTTAAITNRQANAFYKALGFDPVKQTTRRYCVGGNALRHLAEKKER